MNGWRRSGLFLALVLSACSGSSSGGSGTTGSCGNAACGGGATGTWHAQKVCFDATQTQTQTIQGCNDPATIRLKSETISGTLTIDKGGTWTSAFNEDFTANASFPQSCVADSTACTNIETSLKQQSGITSASCTFASNCGCDYGGSTSNNSTGTYQINGTSVTLTTDGSTSPPETDGYCVSGNTLTLTSTASGATSSLVFTR